MTASPEQRDFEKEAIGQLASEMGYSEEVLKKVVASYKDLACSYDEVAAAVAVRERSKWLEAEELMRELIYATAYTGNRCGEVKHQRGAICECSHHRAWHNKAGECSYISCSCRSYRPFGEQALTTDLTELRSSLETVFRHLACPDDNPAELAERTVGAMTQARMKGQAIMFGFTYDTSGGSISIECKIPAASPVTEEARPSHREFCEQGYVGFTCDCPVSPILPKESGDTTTMYKAKYPREHVDKILSQGLIDKDQAEAMLREIDQREEGGAPIPERWQKVHELAKKGRAWIEGMQVGMRDLDVLIEELAVAEEALREIQRWSHNPSKVLDLAYEALRRNGAL